MKITTIYKSLLLSLMLLTGINIMAEVNVNANDEAAMYFRTASSRMDVNVNGNKEEMKLLEQMASEYVQSSDSQRYVIVRSYASPEGLKQKNSEIAKRRAVAAMQLFKKLTDNDNVRFVTEYHMYEWEYLRQLVAADSLVPAHDKVMAVLDKAVEKGSQSYLASQTVIRKLRQIKGGAAYRYLYKNMFPRMRRVEVEVVGTDASSAEKPAVVVAQPEEPENTVKAEQHQDTVKTQQVEIKDTVEVKSQEQIEVKPEVTPEVKPEAKPEVKPEVKPQEGKPLYLALKTNLLFDAVLVPNISLEWGFADHWSVSAEYMHAWWKSDRSHRYWRTYGGNVELRYWFGRKAQEKRLTGHHVGAYFGLLTYDFEWGGKGYLARNASTNIGLSYGYALPIARRLNLDFEIGIGYFSGKYDEYEPRGDYYFWEATKNRKWFGPTRLEATLVWLLGKGNTNAR